MTLAAVFSSGSANSTQSAESEKMPKPPEYSRYSSMQDFFNEKRQILLNSTPPTHNFHGRVLSNTRGQLIWPPPDVRMREVLSPDRIKQTRGKSRNRKRAFLEDPRYFLTRNQMIEMWNAEFSTSSEKMECEQAMMKMRGLIKKYGLQEYPVQSEEIEENRPLRKKRNSRHICHINTELGGSRSSPKKRKTISAELIVKSSLAEALTKQTLTQSPISDSEVANSTEPTVQLDSEFTRKQQGLRSKLDPALVPPFRPPSTRRNREDVAVGSLSEVLQGTHQALQNMINGSHRPGL